MICKTARWFHDTVLNWIFGPEEYVWEYMFSTLNPEPPPER